MVSELSGFAHIRKRAGGSLPRVPARQQLLKRQNLALVLGRIAASPGASRAQLAARTGLTKATVSTLVDALMEAELVIERDPERGLVGRPGSPLILNPYGPAGLGIEINVDYISACIVDTTGAVRYRQKVMGDNRMQRPELVIEKAARAAMHLCSQAEGERILVSGLGVALPGLVDFDGVLHRAPNLLEWQGISVGELLCEMLERPLQSVHCDNEANLAALGEYWFGRRDLQDFVFVSGEIGVGAGIVIGGELFRGVNGLGGELGHVTVDPSGNACGCGGRGCLESVAGQEALITAAGLLARGTGATAHGDDGPADELLRRAHAGEEATLSALEKAGTALGVALSSFLNVLDLPVVVLGGFYADLAPWLLGPVNTELRDRVVNHPWSSIEVVISSLGAEAALRGAAAISTRRIIDDPAAWFPEVLTRS